MVSARLMAWAAGELLEQKGACLAGGRRVGELACELAVALGHVRADDLVEQWPQRLDDEVERSGDEQGLVPEGAVAPYPGDGLGKGAESEKIAEQLVAVETELVDGRPFIAAVKGPEEVAAVTAVQPRAAAAPQRTGRPRDAARSARSR